MSGVGREQFGDSEIEQARRAVLGDEDVVGLEVAVDHQSLVRELHRVAHREEQREPSVDAHPAIVAVARAAACRRRTP